MGQTSQLSRQFWRHYHGTDERASNRWKIAIFSMLVLFPGVGSGGSAVFGGLWLFSLPYLMFDRDSRLPNRAETVLLTVFAAYFLIMAGFAALAAVELKQTSGFGAIYSNLPFLLFGAVLPVLRRAVRPDWIPMVFSGVAWGAIMALAIVTIGAYFYPEVGRKALSGNSLVMALGVLISGLLCIHAAIVFRGQMRWLAAIGGLASFCVLLISGSRGPLLAYGAAATLYAVIMGYRHFGVRWMLSRVVVWLLLVAAIVVTVTKIDPELTDRYSVAIERLANPLDASITENSVYTRLVLYESGIRAFLDRPWTGHGRQNAVRAAKARSDGASDEHFLFSHLHSGYLTDLVSSGIGGLLSLLAVLLVPLVLFWNSQPVVFGGVLCVSLGYIFYGATNLLFYHDVVTLLFLALICVFNALSTLAPHPTQSGEGAHK